MAAAWIAGGEMTSEAAVAAVATAAASKAVDASGQPLDIAEAGQRLRSARYLLLGEIHDNPEHHRLRAEFLRSLLSDGIPTWVVFEQMDRQHNDAIAAAPRNTEAVIEAGQLDRKGWSWPLHRPLFDAALEGGATVVGGNLSRSEGSQVVRGGASRAPPDLQRLLTNSGDDAASTTTHWTAALDAELTRQVDEGHCGALPPDLVAPMALAQRARDAALASAMMQAPAGTRVVLIAGNGHVRRDIGVPHYLAANDARTVSIGVLERAADGTTFVDAPYDEAWFTSGLERPDPCESFRPPGRSR
ncbi:MAG: ChaN family lipoprotein [Rhizobacter sp.]